MSEEPLAGPPEEYLLNYKNGGHFPACTLICSQSPEIDKEGKALEAQSQKLDEQALPKSINHSATKYPSLPGVEGAPARPARFTARGTPPKLATEKNATESKTKSPKARISDIPPEPERARPRLGSSSMPREISPRPLPR